MKLLLLLFLFLHIHPTLSGSLPEYQALLLVKAAITDDPQRALTSWNGLTNHCTWAHVTCDPSHYHVTALDLSKLNLSGTLSPDLAHLRFLPIRCR
jgi:hypothetical protein